MFVSKVLIYSFRIPKLLIKMMLVSFSLLHGSLLFVPALKFTFGSLAFDHDLSTYMSLIMVPVRQSVGLINVNICALSSSWKTLLKCFIKSKMLLTVTHTIFCVLLRKRKTARDVKM